MVERARSAKLEYVQKRLSLFANNYVGEGANFGDDLQFDDAKINNFLRMIGSKGSVVVAPMPLDGNPVKGKPEFDLDKESIRDSTVIRVNGRRIVQQCIDERILDPQKMKSRFVGEFNRILRDALIEYSHEVSLGAAIKAKISWLILFRGRNLVREKVESTPIPK